MNNVLRFTAIGVTLIVAILLVLGVGGVLTSEELRSNLTKVGELAAIWLGASILILLVAKTKN